MNAGLDRLAAQAGAVLGGKSRSLVSRSSTNYRAVELAEENTESVTVRDIERNVVMEITPYPSSGIAQVATMTAEQFLKVSEYILKQSKWLMELNKPELRLDMTYVPERSWNKDTLNGVPRGSAIFPVLELATVPLESVKDYLSP